MRLWRQGGDPRRGQWLVQPHGSLNQAFPLVASAAQRIGQEPMAIDWAASFDKSKPVSIKDLPLSAPVPDHLPMLYAIGLNYREHIKETKMEAPTFPIIIGKAPTSVTGPRSPILIPQCTSLQRPEVDFEVELAVVIGKRARNVQASEALDYILGFTVANDVSARIWQDRKRGGGQWTRAKSFDTFCPLGPCIRLSEPGLDHGKLQLTSAIKKKDQAEFREMQNGNTSDLLFGVSELVSFISQDTTLLPWTVISTGTPSGVGYTRKPPVLLAPGDVIRCEIQDIGALENSVQSESLL